MSRPAILALTSIVLGIFVMVADQSGVMVALPSVSEYFKSDLPTTQWIFIAYILSISVSLLPMGRVADLIGRKRIYSIGFAIHCVTTLAGGLSQSIFWLIGISFLRGLGSGMTQGTSMALIVSIFGREKGGRALGVFISAVGVGSVLGSIMAGYLVSNFSWRTLFIVLSAMSLAALLSGMVFLRKDDEKWDLKGLRFDWIGAFLFTLGLAGFLQGMTWSQELGYGSPLIIILFLFSAVCFCIFVIREFMVELPLMDLRYFKRRLFSSGVSSAFLFFLGNSTVFFFMPFYFQIVLGYSPSQIGYMSAASALTMASVGIISGQYSDKYEPSFFTSAGLLIGGVGLFILANVDMSSSWLIGLSGMVVSSFGLGVFYGPNNKLILSSVPAGSHGVVSGFIHLVRNSANVISVAVGILIVTSSMSSMGFAPTLAGLSSETDAPVLAAFVNGMKVSFGIGGAMLILGFIVAISGGRYKEIESDNSVEHY